MFDKRLSYTVNDPYKTFITLNKKPQNGANEANWCHETNVTQMANALVDSAIKLQDDYLLKDLAETFNLSSDLLASAV